MAISKIKIGNVEHELETTISNVYGLQDELDAKQPKGNYATENYVMSKIAEAELAGEGVDLSSYATKDEIPTKTSELTNDSNFLTSIPGEYITETELNAKGYLTEHQSLEGLATETYVNTQIAAIPAPDVSGQINAHNTATDSHNDIRLLVEGLTTRLNALADSDDTTLDQMSEIVAYIKSNKNLIDGITTNKVSVSDIVDNLTTNASNKPLSAAQGAVLKALIDAVVVPTKVSELTNDKGYLTSVPSEYITETELNTKGYLTEHQSLVDYVKTEDLGSVASKDIISKSDLASDVQISLDKADTALQSYTETDPTVPAWAKEATKPTYTAAEVGALPDTTVVPDALADLMEDSTHRLVTDSEKEAWNVAKAHVDSDHVTSVNGMSGSVVINIPEAVSIDTTLTQEGRAADSKAVGDALNSLTKIVAFDDGEGNIELKPFLTHEAFISEVLVGEY